MCFHPQWGVPFTIYIHLGTVYDWTTGGGKLCCGGWLGVYAPGCKERGEGISKPQKGGDGGKGSGRGCVSNYSILWWRHRQCIRGPRVRSSLVLALCFTDGTRKAARCSCESRSTQPLMHRHSPLAVLVDRRPFDFPLPPLRPLSRLIIVNQYNYFTMYRQSLPATMPH